MCFERKDWILNIRLMKYLLDWVDKNLYDWVDEILAEIFSRLGWQHSCTIGMKNTWRQVAEIIVKIWWRNTRGWVDEMLVSLGWWSWMQIAFLIVPPVINLSLGCIQFKPFHTSQMPFLASILQYHFHHVWGEHVDFLGSSFFKFWNTTRNLVWTQKYKPSKSLFCLFLDEAV